MPLGAFKAALMGTAGVSTENIVLLATNTITSGVASSVFTSGITSTYPMYIFRYYNIHPASDGASGFRFQVSIDGGSNYNVACTSTFFRTDHMENDSASELEYNASYDLAQGTDYQTLETNVGNDNDQCCAGELHLFNPASTTYVKHFYATSSDENMELTATSSYTAGYINVTAAIDEISFKFASGNMNGTIQMYGIA